MKPRKKLNIKRARRAATSAVIVGSAERPRLSVHRTNRYFYAQLIDDAKGNTLLFASTVTLQKEAGKKTKQSKSESAFAVGELIGKKAVEKGIKQVVFDRRSYRFHGRVKQFADGAKSGTYHIIISPWNHEDQ